MHTGAAYPPPPEQEQAAPARTQPVRPAGNGRVQVTQLGRGSSVLGTASRWAIRGRNAAAAAPNAAAKITRSGDTSQDRIGPAQAAGVMLPTTAAIPCGFVTPPHATVAGSED